ncbi:VOC family protein (plasmid) [Anabaena sp. FACHB-709]|uniref:Glyoxalase/bleomycin resistance protein/dioxygenase n=6 Tax=Nostocaceae TaxID=1162 RepID=A0A1Z4KVJ1_ANAVA|nr:MULTISPECIES: VOC family protein [Nostocaceae]BAY72964.1 glyoxalase/bleomycin resistance protein/dioxygenase [Trichormus variabilis NIES-23]ABA24719.1 Glyoxalase/bleomycin resistance protein/dioxygenase [Trichormus variabilis ATCC 29413]MBC1217996.1 VOC family protein [Trichormus variabilis ARAD]MBC1270844.1 VOC family protein [Trichormus variabilis FSR]MBC1305551.1 VOC family protein [Trichormus variabilis N2B]
MKEFELKGINHLALVCRDFQETIDFYTITLGLKLIKNIDLPSGGKHFFIDIGNNNTLAFFWSTKAPESVPGISSVRPEAFLTGDIITAHGSMNHVAFHVPLEKLEEYKEKLVSKGVQTTPVLHHTDVPMSSFYFFDPNGILLEFAANLQSLDTLPAELKEKEAIFLK